MISRHLRVGVLTAALLAAGAVTASGQDAPDQLSFSFTTAKAKTSAGWNLEAEFPRRRFVDEITIAFPPGTKIDRTAVPRCTASSEETDANADKVQGVCPPESQIGTGKATVYVGDDPKPTVFDLALYNHTTVTIVDIRLGGKTAFFSGATMKGRRLVIPLDRTPELKARITGVELTVEKGGTRRKPYLRTPATCPAKGRWTASIAAREAGAGRVTTSDATACRR